MISMINHSHQSPLSSFLFPLLSLKKRKKKELEKPVNKGSDGFDATLLSS